MSLAMGTLGLLAEPPRADTIDVKTTARTPSPATRKYTPSGPITLYSTPPTDGAIKVVTLIAAASRDMAFVRLSFPTSCGTSA